ncbi:small-subunit processome [Gloeopeniophorella convolvens]|nr:small-subunit processome [Gloeopeniophorella convolvens]
MSSSLRNSLHRRNHKERSQLSHRQRLGILEKHKDYVLRARDYHSKQDRIQRLRQKAADRNKDEFYFRMNRERTEGGVHVQDRGNSSLPADMVKVLKTQDENYIRTMRTAGLKKIEKLKNQLSTLADLLTPSHADDMDEDEDGEGSGLDEEELEVLARRALLRGRLRYPNGVFVDNDEEARQYVASAKSSAKPRLEEPEVAPAVVNLGWKQDDKQKKGKGRAVRAAEAADDAAAANRTHLLKELSARLHRDRMLRYAERELEMQKLLMGKGRSKKVQGVEKVGGEGESEDEDALDARRGRPSSGKGAGPVEEKAYKPRVYKWRAERKR